MFRYTTGVSILEITVSRVCIDNGYDVNDFSSVIGSVSLSQLPPVSQSPPLHWWNQNAKC